MEYWKRLRKAVGTEQLILPSAVSAIVKDMKIILVEHGALKNGRFLVG